MNVLDQPNKVKNNNYSSKVTLIILSLIFLLGIGFEIEAIYTDYWIAKFKVENPGFTYCFVSSYSMRWFVQLLVIIGFLLSSLELSRRDWMTYKSKWKNILIFCPMIILIFDQLIINFVLK